MTWTVVSSSPSFGRYSDEPLDLLRDAGCEVTLLPRDDRSALVAGLRVADAWVVGFEPVDASTLAAAPSVRVVAKSGAGMDNFDLPYLAERGIQAVNVPGGNSDAVAEYAIGQLLALARGISVNDRSIRGGRWGPTVGMGLAGRVLGVVGFGRIGQRLGALAAAFGMSVLATDPAMSPEEIQALGAEPAELQDLLLNADVVSVHVPLVDGTRNLISVGELALMPAHAFLLNCSRGGVVDEAALVDALGSGRLGGAAADVFTLEPLPADSPLFSAPNMLLSSHTAGYSDTALAAVTLQCAQKVLTALKARP
jgi:phosphoglycerate dehydrogenase-like enzyme